MSGAGGRGERGSGARRLRMPAFPSRAPGLATRGVKRSGPAMQGRRAGGRRSGGRSREPRTTGGPLRNPYRRPDAAPATPSAPPPRGDPSRTHDCASDPASRSGAVLPAGPGAQAVAIGRRCRDMDARPLRRRSRLDEPRPARRHRPDAVQARPRRSVPRCRGIETGRRPSTETWRRGRCRRAMPSEPHRESRTGAVQYRPRTGLADPMRTACVTPDAVPRMPVCRTGSGRCRPRSDLPIPRASIRCGRPHGTHPLVSACRRPRGRMTRRRMGPGCGGRGAVTAARRRGRPCESRAPRSCTPRRDPLQGRAVPP